MRSQEVGHWVQSHIPHIEPSRRVMVVVVIVVMVVVVVVMVVLVVMMGGDDEIVKGDAGIKAKTEVLAVMEGGWLAAD